MNHPPMAPPTKITMPILTPTAIPIVDYDEVVTLITGGEVVVVFFIVVFYELLLLF